MKCATCQKMFKSWSDYNVHHRFAHNGQNKVIIPEKITNRTKAEIVEGFEKRMGVAIISLLLIGLFILPVKAEDNDKDGKQGPQGIQGNMGLTGPSGTNASVSHYYGGIDLGLTVYSGQYVDIGLFNSIYAAPSDWANISGISLQFSLGPNYSDKQTKKLEDRIEALEKQLAVKFVTNHD